MAELNLTSEAPLVDMDRGDDMYVMGQTSGESRCDARTLGRLGAELKNVYSDTLQAPLPFRLQALIDRLDDALVSTARREPPCGCR